jgi:hypothetical protein
MNNQSTISELKQSLRKMGIRGYSNKNKSDLIIMYNKANTARKANISTEKRAMKNKSPQKRSKSGFDVLFDTATVDIFRKYTGLPSDMLLTKKETLSDKKKKRSFVGQLDDTLCGSDLSPYLLDALKRANKPSTEYANPESDIVMDYIYIKNSDDKLCAILVAHRGECAKIYNNDVGDMVTTDKPLWNWWTVRLICNRDIPECKGNASKLLGAYCYVLKKKQIQSHGLLEVAGDYGNIPGYCIYSRYGFVESDFPCQSFEWMQMATNLRTLTTRQIINTVLTGKKSISETGATLYCEELKSVSKRNILTDSTTTESQFPRDRYDPVFTPVQVPFMEVDENIDVTGMENIEMDITDDDINEMDTKMENENCIIM